ncbi:MAG: RNA 2',3'-cyclic phosphodiesterase [Mycobacteriales bacterium]
MSDARWRMFVAVDLAPAATASLAAVLDGIGDLPAARWLERSTWHLTMAFLGDVPTGRVARLDRGFAAVAAATEPFPLRVAGGGTFPERGAPRLLWAGVDGDGGALQQLATAVGRAARAGHLRLERRPFTPHLTLARFRNAPHGAADPALAALAGYTGPTCLVREFALVRSELGPPLVHTPVHTYRLGEPTNPATS